MYYAFKYLNVEQKMKQNEKELRTDYSIGAFTHTIQLLKLCDAATLSKLETQH